MQSLMTQQGDMLYTARRSQDEKNRQNLIQVEDKKLQIDWLHAQMRIAHSVRNMILQSNWYCPKNKHVNY